MSEEKRNRNTVGLTQGGKDAVLAQLSIKGWSQEIWAGLSYVSVSTAKRLLAGQRIYPDNLASLLRELGLELNEAYLMRNISGPTMIKTVAAADGVLSTDYQLGVFMVGQYNKDNKAEIDRAVSHLRGLMVGTEFSFEEIEGTIVVNGSFIEEKEPQIRAVVQHLENLLTSPTVSWHGQPSIR
jgi:repressor of nif and glnA expression